MIRCTRCAVLTIALLTACTEPNEPVADAARVPVGRYGPSPTLAAPVPSTTIGNAIDIGNFGAPAVNSNQLFINVGGDVVGTMMVPNVGPHVARWTPSTGLVDLGPGLCGGSGYVFGFNDAGQIAGMTQGCQSVPGYLFRWSPTTGFETLSGEKAPYGAVGYGAINASGDVAGVLQTLNALDLVRWMASGEVVYATYTDRSSIITIEPTLFINDVGMVAGTLYLGVRGDVAFVWEPGQPVREIGPNLSWVTGINSSGTVVGNYVSPNGDRAFRWTKSDGFQDLGVNFVARPVGVSDDETIAGTAAAGTGAAGFRWTPAGGFQFLAALNMSVEVGAVSRNGIISGRFGVSINEAHAFRWTPELGLEDLGALGGLSAEGFSVNTKGLVAGFWWPGDGDTRWARWEGLANGPPIAATDGARTGTEGSSVSFSAVSSTDPDADVLTYAWDFGDRTAACAGTTVGGTSATPTHTYCDEGTYTVVLTVTDGRGGSAQASTTATIINVAPTVTVGATATVLLGQPFALNATFGDPGKADSPWSYSVDWADNTGGVSGSLATTADAISASHTFAQVGTYAVTITVTDADGAAGTGTVRVTVRTNSPPTAAITGPTAFPATVEQQFSGTGSTDPDGDALTYAWDTGNGQTFTGPTVRYAYPAAGTYTIRLTVTDIFGASASATHTVSVSAPPKPLAVSVTATSPTVWVGEPSWFTATVKDPCTGGCTATVTWATGVVTTHAIPATTSGASTMFTLSHTYPAAGQYDASLSIANQAGARGSASTPNPPRLRVALKSPIVVNPGCEPSPIPCIQPKSWLLILVSSAPGVLPANLDLAKITLGDNVGTNEAKPDHCNLVPDRTGDGVQDVVCQFFKTDVSRALAKGAATFYLNGTLQDGRPVQGRTAVSGL